MKSKPGIFSLKMAVRCLNSPVGTCSFGAELDPRALTSSLHRMCAVGWARKPRRAMPCSLSKAGEDVAYVSLKLDDSVTNHAIGRLGNDRQVALREWPRNTALIGRRSHVTRTKPRLPAGNFYLELQ